MFSRIEITVPTATLKRIEKTVQSAPGLMGTAFDRAVRRLRTQLVQELAKEPPKAAGKREWTSERQRIAVIIKLKKAGNLPYRRTHTLAKGYRTDLKTSKDGGIFTVFNKVPYRRFVTGANAQRMHIKSGWPQENAVIPKFRQQAKVVLFQTWKTVSSPTAGVGKP